MECPGAKYVAQLLLAFALLVLGGAIYLLLRPQVLLIHQVAWSAGLGAFIHWGRALLEGTSLPEWFVFNLPGGLWSAAYILVVDSVIGAPHPSRRSQSDALMRLAVAAFIPAAGIVSEVLQSVHLLPGTFDVIDLLAYAIPYAIYVILFMFNSSPLSATPANRASSSCLRAARGEGA